MNIQPFVKNLIFRKKNLWKEAFDLENEVKVTKSLKIVLLV